MKIRIWKSDTLQNTKGFNEDHYEYIKSYITKAFAKGGITVEITEGYTTSIIEEDRQKLLNTFSRMLPRNDYHEILLSAIDEIGKVGLHITGVDTSTAMANVKLSSVYWSKSDSNILAFLATHELGHGLGLNHFNRPKDDINNPKYDKYIMQYPGMHIPSLEDLDVLDIWGEEDGIVLEEKKLDYYILPEKINYPVNLEDITKISNVLCWTTSGKLEHAGQCYFPTYNSSGYQRYRHTAVDFSVDNSKDNYFINPFVDGIVKVTNIKMDEPDDYILPYPNPTTPEQETANKNAIIKQQAERHGQKGNYITLEYRSEDGDNLKRFTCYGCHLKQNSALVKRGDIIKPNQKLAKIGWSGYSSKEHAHLHFNVNYRGYQMDLFDRGIWSFKDFVGKLAYNNNKSLYPEHYTPTYQPINEKFTVSLNGSDTVESTYGKKEYTLVSNRPMQFFWHTHNPYGEVMDFDLFEMDFDFDFNEDRTVCKFTVDHYKPKGEHAIKSLGEYKYYIMDEKGNKSNTLTIKLI